MTALSRGRTGSRIRRRSRPGGGLPASDRPSFSWRIAMAVSTRTTRTVHPALRTGGRPLTSEDLWKIPRVGVPAPAPDGTWAVVPVTTYDLEKNEGRTRLWMISATGAFEPRPLTSPELTSTAPRVSPDGTRVAFVRKRDKAEKAQ